MHDRSLQLTWSYLQRALEVSSARGWAQEETLLVLFSKGVIIMRPRTCLEKKRSCLICDSSCCRTSCVGVQPYTSRDLPNTETFLPSRVFSVPCVVPALCQVMYSLSVCSDGTTSAAPRSFRQNRPPARTLSLTCCTCDLRVLWLLWRSTSIRGLSFCLLLASDTTLSFSLVFLAR